MNGDGSMRGGAVVDETPLRPVTPVAIIADKLTALRERVGASTALDAESLRLLDDAAALAGGLDPYLDRCTTPDSPALEQLVAATREEPWAARFAAGETVVELEAEMLSGHVEGQFLKTLVYATRARRILEIGLFTGYSALAMAEALPDDGTLIACELDPFVARFAQRAFTASPHGEKIRVHVGPALERLRRLQADGERFDLVFIDADKGSYVEYLDAVLEGGLLAEHGIVCVDNTLMQGKPYLDRDPGPTGAAIATFNRYVRDDARVEQVVLPLRDGLTIIRRK